MNIFEITQLSLELKAKKEELKNLFYGSVEIREINNKKVIYLHYREEGLSLTRYAGEYTDELYNLVLNNNVRAKALKKEIKKMTKELKDAGYIEQSINQEVALNIDFAKKHMADTIYQQAVLEGIATTYADTETIIEGGKVNNMTADDVLKVVNLKHAWEFILNPNVILSKTNFSLLCEINKLIDQGFHYTAGKLRSTPVSIGGTSWKPSIPIESVVKEELEEILTKEMAEIDKAVELLLYIMKKQIFLDGNKRTSVIFANHYLIQKGKGLIVIPNERVEEYKRFLIDFYEGKGDNEIKKFIKEFCFKSY